MKEMWIVIDKTRQVKESSASWLRWLLKSFEPWMASVLIPGQGAKVLIVETVEGKKSGVKYLLMNSAGMCMQFRIFTNFAKAVYGDRQRVTDCRRGPST